MGIRTRCVCQRSINDRLNNSYKERKSYSSGKYALGTTAAPCPTAVVSPF